jgi:hypothetical protein
VLRLPGRAETATETVAKTAATCRSAFPSLLTHFDVDAVRGVGSSCASPYLLSAQLDAQLAP